MIRQAMLAVFVLCVLCLAPAMAQVPSNSLIFNVAHDGNSALHAGAVLTVTMVGQPGGSATFDVGKRTGIPMTEYSPGNYSGRYMVGLNDFEPRAIIMVHLLMPDGEVADLVAPPSVGFEGFK